MEAIAAASSIIAIVELTVNVTVWCARYARDVSRGPEDICLLSQETGTLAIAISRLQGANIPDDTRDRLRPAFQLCLDDLKCLEKTLKPAKNVVERLAWPFKKRGEVKDAIGKIQRHTTLFNAAIVVDLLVLTEKLRYVFLWVGSLILTTQVHISRNGRRLRLEDTTRRYQALSGLKLL